MNYEHDWGFVPDDVKMLSDNLKPPRFDPSVSLSIPETRKVGLLSMGLGVTDLIVNPDGVGARVFQAIDNLAESILPTDATELVRFFTLQGPATLMVEGLAGYIAADILKQYKVADERRQDVRNFLHSEMRQPR